MDGCLVASPRVIPNFPSVPPYPASYPSVPELSVRGESELFVPFTGSVAFPMEL